MNQSGTPQVLSNGNKLIIKDGIIPLGDGMVFVTSLGAVVDEEKIAGAGNWRMPLSKTMTLGIIAAILLVGTIIRKKTIVQ